MKLIGLILLIFGLGPLAADHFGFDATAFAWIDRWGPEMALILRSAMIAFGAAFMLPGKAPEKPTPKAVREWTPHRRDRAYPDPIAGLYNRHQS